MKKKFESELRHNNSGYGYGKFWVAKIIDTHPTYKFLRNFAPKPKVNYINNSKTTWFTFSTIIEIENGDYIEFCEENNFKTLKNYYIVKNNELVGIEKEDISFL